MPPSVVVRGFSLRLVLNPLFTLRSFLPHSASILHRLHPARCPLVAVSFLTKIKNKASVALRSPCPFLSFFTLQNSTQPQVLSTKEKVQNPSLSCCSFVRRATAAICSSSHRAQIPKLQRCLPGYPFKCPKLQISPENGLSESDTDKLLSLLRDQI